MITGYYSDKRNSRSSNGAYIIRLEYDGKTVKDIKTTYCEFPSETLKAYESEKVKKRMDKKESKEGDLEASNLYFDKIVFSEDGSVLIIGEEYYVVSHTYSNGKTSYTTYTYYYEDLLVLKADKNGKTVWCTKIPKAQSGSGTAYLSYFHKNFNGEDYFFYNEGRDFISAKLDQRGNMTKSTIFNTKTEDVYVYPRSFESVNKNVMVDRQRTDRKESKIFRMEIR